MPKPTSPATVGALRGVLLAVAIAAIGALVAALTGLDLATLGVDPTYRPLIAVVIVIVARWLEAVLLDLRRGQAPQAGPLGGKPANPADYTADE